MAYLGACIMFLKISKIQFLGLKLIKIHTRCLVKSEMYFIHYIEILQYKKNVEWEKTPQSLLKMALFI